jgi:peptide deformylase
MPGAILKIARMGHPVLRAKAAGVSREALADPAFQRLVDDMIATIEDYDGAGLAAPQVHISLRLFVVSPSIEGSTVTTPLVFVNPEVALADAAPVEDWEGCLSMPGLTGRVPRRPDLVVRALDRHGARIERSASAFLARVIQHEHDHLNGVLFIDRMRSLASLRFVQSASGSLEPNSGIIRRFI